jgi:hypothetical protein
MGVSSRTRLLWSALYPNVPEPLSPLSPEPITF